MWFQGEWVIPIFGDANGNLCHFDSVIEKYDNHFG